MFEINEEGFVVDEKGLPLSGDQLIEVSVASAKSLNLGGQGRVELAEQLCRELHPSMVDQVNFDSFY